MIAKWVYLTVSILSMTVQTTALLRLMRGPDVKGLRRTAICRVIASSLYVTIGMLAFLGSPVIVGTAALVIFTSMQLLWQANAIADVRLRRKLRTGTVGVHRR